mmetsp:Transcript_9672/g.27658  ORF Transcript_9672/g.27658 Transcript_9672/m.27658 type:complete len:187 (-) Transcript_9672:263-823(-)|eukprot:CAMPEP_0117651660 /NCGR_PEP_ID=MMETSP0804-20121206/2213_1 /TAXON_ID=1074897 /ORGANISM="Tetraselmis astigmatica, Strain CCMP880" /LENGTH=186 /DNA_ID=CAMNT_0005457657 /DNA_START=202 /DNA_END=762 /DNA_ORIENTATION=-
MAANTVTGLVAGTPLTASKSWGAVSKARGGQPTLASRNAQPGRRGKTCVHQMMYRAQQRQKDWTCLSSMQEEPDSADRNQSRDGKSWDKATLMAQIKSYGISGTISYIITELMFWAIALPAAAYSYHSSTGEWLSWSTDKAQLVGIAAGFVTVVRFAVPLRMAAALALTPLVERTIVKRSQEAKGE